MAKVLAEGVSIAQQFGVQLVGVIVRIIYCALLSAIIFKIVDAVVGLRVNEDEEIQGLDIALHDEQGYNMEL